jgi:hypothetical protein
MDRDCKAGPDNEFVFVRFFYGNPSGSFDPARRRPAMFVFDRSALAVLVPLAMLAGAVLWSNRGPGGGGATQQTLAADAGRGDQAVAANLPSR